MRAEVEMEGANEAGSESDRVERSRSAGGPDDGIADARRDIGDRGLGCGSLGSLDGEAGGGRDEPTDVRGGGVVSCHVIRSRCMY